MSRARQTFSRLLADATANVLPLAGMALILAAALTGGGIDMGRAWRVENRLQAACDSAVLAGRRAVTNNGFDTTAQQQAQRYFNTNFDESRLEAHDTTFDPQSAEDGNIINATARTTIDTAVMQMFGFDDFDLSVQCTASMGVGNSDVVMVLDTTGSMDTALGSSTRIQALRSAMKNFYDTVKTATQGSNSRIRYGFVPFSQAVNTGALLMAESPDYIVDKYWVQTRVPIWKQVTTYGGTPTEITNSEITGYSGETASNPKQFDTTDYSSDSDCVTALPPGLAWKNTNDPPSTNGNESAPYYVGDKKFVKQPMKQKQIKTTYVCQSYKNKKNTLWRRYYVETTRFAYYDRISEYDPVYSKDFDKWEYRWFDYDTDRYKLGEQVVTPTGDKGANKTSAVWNGCIEERSTVNTATYSYSSITGMSPADALDLNLDLAPDPADDATKWRPMWNEVAYYRNGDSDSVMSSGTKAGFACPRAARLMAEMDEGEFDAYADSLFAQGSTYLDLGMIWGGRLSSPDGIFKDNVDVDPDNGGEVSRHLIFMTDGDMDPTQTSQTSYGIEFTDRRITYGGLTMSETDTVAKARHLARFRAICSAIKDKGIRVWVIAFTTGLSTDLKNCASANSSFTANSSTQLNTAFQEIAKQVGELRITQ